MCVCVCKTEKVCCTESINSPIKYHILIVLWFMHYINYIAHKSMDCFDHWPPPFTACLSLPLSPGRIFSRWARGGLWLLPPAILAGRAYRGGGGDRYPAYLCVLCLPVLPPRLCLTVSGLLLCSQVSCQDLNQLHHPFSVVLKAIP